MKRTGVSSEVSLAGDSEALVVLLRRVASHDEAAFAALYRRTSGRLSGVVARILPRENGSADALQDAYLKIWERAGDFDPARGSPMTWMATIARNRALDEARRVRPLSWEIMPDGFDPPGDSVDPMATRERSEQRGALIDCLRKLDEEKRAILLLAYYHGASRDVLSKRFGRPVPTIKNWLSRSPEQLRGCLDAHGCCGKRPSSPLDRSRLHFDADPGTLAREAKCAPTSLP
jgi:RNA polymerase sigma-70 factor (ECF subfamily)